MIKRKRIVYSIPCMTAQYFNVSQLGSRFPIAVCAKLNKDGDCKHSVHVEKKVTVTTMLWKEICLLYEKRL